MLRVLPQTNLITIRVTKPGYDAVILRFCISGGDAAGTQRRNCRADIVDFQTKSPVAAALQLARIVSRNDFKQNSSNVEPSNDIFRKEFEAKYISVELNSSVEVGHVVKNRIEGDFHVDCLW